LVVKKSNSVVKRRLLSIGRQIGRQTRHRLRDDLFFMSNVSNVSSTAAAGVILDVSRYAKNNRAASLS
jgi:hypothetical protein